MLAAEEHAVAVDRVDLAPGGQVGIDNSAQGDHASIVDQDIQAAEFLQRGADHGLPVVLIGHVQAQEQGVGADAPGHLHSIRLVKVRHDYTGAFARKQDGVRLAHPAGPSGDDCYFAGHSSHLVSFPRLSVVVQRES